MKKLIVLFILFIASYAFSSTLWLDGVVQNGIDQTSVEITGGTIDGVVIGDTTPAAINGTTGTFTESVSAGNAIYDNIYSIGQAGRAEKAKLGL